MNYLQYIARSVELKGSYSLEVGLRDGKVMLVKHIPIKRAQDRYEEGLICKGLCTRPPLLVLLQKDGFKLEKKETISCTVSLSFILTLFIL